MTSLINALCKLARLQACTGMIMHSYISLVIHALYGKICIPGYEEESRSLFWSIDGRRLLFADLHQASYLVIMLSTCACMSTNTLTRVLLGWQGEHDGCWGRAGHQRNAVYAQAERHRRIHLHRALPAESCRHRSSNRPFVVVGVVDVVGGVVDIDSMIYEVNNEIWNCRCAINSDMCIHPRNGYLLTHAPNSHLPVSGSAWLTTVASHSTMNTSKVN